jgi:methionyl-tRNA formyltransferase
VTKVRLAFLGTPFMAVPTLKALIADPRFTVVAVVCQPDKPAGRGNKLHAPPVKELALSQNIPVLQPEKLSKSEEAIETLKTLGTELIVMVAFGQILKKSVLTLPPEGVINLHFSLLPHYRGAAPVNWAIINGDTETGVCTMFTEAGLDTGPVLLRHSVKLDENINAEELSRELADIGASVTILTLEKLLAKELTPEKQDDTNATFAPMLSKELGLIDWSRSARDIHNLVRGLIPWPSAYTQFRGHNLKIWKTACNCDETAIDKAKSLSDQPGQIFELARKLYVKCDASGHELLELLEVQPENKAKMKAADWLNGAHITSQDIFGK